MIFQQVKFILRAFFLLYQVENYCQSLTSGYEPTLRCWQCAVTKEFRTSCPRDSVMYELTGWDACMTWKLDNGTVLLQNFVKREEDCTPKRLAYWEDYISYVFKAPGVAECCYGNECNGLGKHAHKAQYMTETDNQYGVYRPPQHKKKLVNCFDCRQIQYARCDIQDNTDAKGYMEQEQRPETFLKRRPLFQNIGSLNYASKRYRMSKPMSLVESIVSNAIRVSFDTMVESLSSERGVCECMDGFIPIKVLDEVLMECHDPIIQTAVVGGRCLISDHCAALENTECQDDLELQEGTGIDSYKTCQCIDGYVLDESSGICTEESDEDESLTESEEDRDETCQQDADCSIQNSLCVFVDSQEPFTPSQILEAMEDFVSSTARQGIADLENLATAVLDDPEAVPDGGDSVLAEAGVCSCKMGYIPIRDRDSNKLIQCRDPIVVTSTVNGRCIYERHCRKLTGTKCLAVGDHPEVSTCQCIEGYEEDEEDEEGIISSCSKVAAGEEAGNVNEEPNSVTILMDEALQGLMNTRLEAIESLHSIRQQMQENPLGNEPETLADDVHSHFDNNQHSYPQLEQPNSHFESYEFVHSDSYIFPGLDPFSALRGASSCSREIIVVERDEWVPGTRFPIQEDKSTGTKLSVLYVRIPNTAEESDGILLRLLQSSNIGAQLYSIRILKNRQIIIGKGSRNSNGEETEVTHMTVESNSERWLHNKDYTGFWVVFNGGFISLGVMDENSVEDPLVTWSDPEPYENIDIIGLSATGSAVYYKAQCSLSSAFPEGVCTVDEDCKHLANTECKRKTVGSSTDENGQGRQQTTLKSCQCKSGYQTIPRIQRTTFIGGCYDPIVRTKTLHGLCLDQIHCQNLPNTVCEVNPFQNNEKQCVCLMGAEPLERNPRTGLIPGCKAPSNMEQSVERCSRRTELGMGSSWIPQTLASTKFDSVDQLYRIQFFLKFDSESTVASVKLLQGDLNPQKFYKITISGTGTISVFENIRRNSMIFDVRNEEILRHSRTFGTRGLIQREYCGFWITYQPDLGRISVGQTAERFPLVQWADTSTTRLPETNMVGFEVERGFRIELATNCE